MSDKIAQSLRALAGALPAPRELNEAEKDALIQTIGGPLTARDVIRAQKDFALARIPFLFSSIDTQAVVDLLHNDMEAALGRAMEAKARRKKS